MPLFWLSIAFFTGILFARWLPCEIPIGMNVAILILALITGFCENRFAERGTFLLKIRQILPQPSGFLLAALVLGVLRYNDSQPQWTEHHLAYYNDQESIHFTAIITRPPETRDGYIQLRIKAVNKINAPTGESLQISPLDGQALLNVRTADIWHYGDRLEISGKIISPSDSKDFSYKEYLAQRGIHSILYYPQVRRISQNDGNFLLRGIYSLRENLYDKVNNLYPQPEASLLCGILLGIESDIPQNVQDDFKATGTTHIIAISGFNIAILAALFTSLFNHLTRNIWKSLLLTSLMIAFYTVMVGNEASVVRAAIMGILGLGGRLIGRKQAGTNSLVFTAALMCFFNPLLLWDISFQLSFSATFGLIFFADAWINTFVRLLSNHIDENLAQKISGPAGEYFIFTIAAQITTLPVILTHFHQVSLNSLLANLLILPVQPPVMILGGISVIIGMFIPILGQGIAAIAWIPTTYTIHIIRWIAEKLPAMLTVPQVDLMWIVFYYSFLILIKQYWEKIIPFLRPRALTWGTLISGTAAIFIWQTVASRPDQYLHYHCKTDDHKHLTCLLITPVGRNVLIENSDSETNIIHLLDEHLPIFERNIDLALMGDLDDEQSFESLNSPGRYRIRHCLIEQEQFEYFLQAGMNPSYVEERLILPLQDGQRIDLSEQASLTILNRVQDKSGFEINWKKFSILSTHEFDNLQNSSLNLLQQMRQNYLLLILDAEGPLSVENKNWHSLQPDLLITTGDCPQNSNGFFTHCLSLQEDDGFSLITDGSHIWLHSYH